VLHLGLLVLVVLMLLRHPPLVSYLSRQFSPLAVAAALKAKNLAVWGAAAAIDYVDVAALPDLMLDVG